MYTNVRFTIDNHTNVRYTILAPEKRRQVHICDLHKTLVSDSLRLPDTAGTFSHRVSQANEELW